MVDWALKAACGSRAWEIRPPCVAVGVADAVAAGVGEKATESARRPAAPGSRRHPSRTRLSFPAAARPTGASAPGGQARRNALLQSCCLWIGCRHAAGVEESHRVVLFGQREMVVLGRDSPSWTRGPALLRGPVATCQLEAAARAGGYPIVSRAQPDAHRESVTGAVTLVLRVTTATATRSASAPCWRARATAPHATQHTCLIN